MLERSWKRHANSFFFGTVCPRVTPGALARMQTVSVVEGQAFSGAYLSKDALLQRCVGLGIGNNLLGSVEVFGFFTKSELNLHFNRKEFKGAIFALRSYMMRDATMQFYTASTTLFHYIRQSGGRHYHLNRLVERLWQDTQEQNVTTVPHYVPSALNPADLPSRRKYTIAQTASSQEMMDPHSLHSRRSRCPKHCHNSPRPGFCRSRSPKSATPATAAPCPCPPPPRNGARLPTLHATSTCLQPPAPTTAAPGSQAGSPPAYPPADLAWWSAPALQELRCWERWACGAGRRDGHHCLNTCPEMLPRFPSDPDGTAPEATMPRRAWKTLLQDAVQGLRSPYTPTPLCQWLQTTHPQAWAIRAPQSPPTAGHKGTGKRQGRWKARGKGPR